MTAGLPGPSSRRYVPRVIRSVSVMDIVSRPVVASLSSQNGRSTGTNSLDDSM